MKDKKSDLDKDNKVSDNLKSDTHHFEIWTEARNPSKNIRPPVYYVENHNAGSGYAEAALDFEMLVTELVPRLSPTSFGNWLGPVLHLSRQTLELKLKALLERVIERNSTMGDKLLTKHNLLAIWDESIKWLLENGYPISQDLRMKNAETLVTAFHAVDPGGDLFRFATSRQTRFKRHKSYDRVGVNYDVFPTMLEDTFNFLRHWEAVLFRERLCKDEGWTEDPYFDPNNFPKS